MKIEIEVKFFMKDLFFFLTPAKPNGIKDVFVYVQS